jgi:hypothetical protein
VFLLGAKASNGIKINQPDSVKGIDPDNIYVDKKVEGFEMKNFVSRTSAFVVLTLEFLKYTASKPFNKLEVFIICKSK